VLAASVVVRIAPTQEIMAGDRRWREGTVITTLTAGTRVQVVDENSGAWGQLYKVRLQDGRQGYVTISDLQLDRDQ
jgi:hypothetical protein